jgi:hypothetical protein
MKGTFKWKADKTVKCHNITQHNEQTFI